MLGIFLRQHLRQRAHHHARIVQRLSGHALAAAQGRRVIRNEERAGAALRAWRATPPWRPRTGHGWQCAARCRTCRRGCVPAILSRAAGHAPQDSRRCRPGHPGHHACSRIVANACDMDARDTRSSSTIMLSPPCALMACSSAAALAACRVVSTTTEALLGKLLGDGAADAPAHADGQVAVVEHLAVRQFGVAAIGLPLGGRPTTTATCVYGPSSCGFLARCVCETSQA